MITFLKKYEVEYVCQYEIEFGQNHNGTQRGNNFQNDIAEVIYECKTIYDWGSLEHAIFLTLHVIERH